MKNEFMKKVAFMSAVTMLAATLAPSAAQPVQAAKKASLLSTKMTAEMEYPTSESTLSVENPNKKAVYTVVSSDTKVIVPVDAYRSYKGDTVTFTFRNRKVGKAKVTVKEKLGKKTRKVGTVKITVDKCSYKPSKADKKNAAKYEKYLKKGIVANTYGVSLEVASIKNLKLNKKEAAAEITLEHAVTASEVKASARGEFGIMLMDKNVVKSCKWITLRTKLKKGVKKFTVSSGDGSDASLVMKKGMTFYISGLKTKENAPYMYTVKVK